MINISISTFPTLYSPPKLHSMSTEPQVYSRVTVPSKPSAVTHRQVHRLHVEGSRYLGHDR